MSGIALRDGFTTTDANLSMLQFSWKCDKILTKTMTLLAIFMTAIIAVMIMIKSIINYNNELDEDVDVYYDYFYVDADVNHSNDYDSVR